MQDEVFPLNLALCMWGHHEFTYEALNRTMPHRIALNQTK